jgi:hypothetical protein
MSKGEWLVLTRTRSMLDDLEEYYFIKMDYIIKINLKNHMNTDLYEAITRLGKMEKRRKVFRLYKNKKNL